MRHYNKWFFLIMLVILSHQQIKAQVIENYNESLKEINESDFFGSLELIQTVLDVQMFPLSGFRFQIPEGSTVFLNHTLWFYTEGDSSFYVSNEKLRENLDGGSNGKVELTILKKGIQKKDVSIVKGYFEDGVELAKEDISDFPVFLKRDINVFYDFFYLALISILFLVAIYKVIYPMVLTSLISPVSVFSAEDFSETNAIQRFFSIDVIFYVLIVCMLISLTGLVIIKEMDFAQWQNLVNGDLNQLFLYWLMGTMILFVITVLKFIILKFLVYIFDLGKYEFSHFIYLLRIISILVFALVLLITYFSLNDRSNLEEVVRYGLVYFFWAYIIGVFLLMLMMMNRVTFKKYHLFAYICTAELIPFLIISKLIIG